MRTSLGEQEFKRASSSDGKTLENNRSDDGDHVAAKSCFISKPSRVPVPGGTLHPLTRIAARPSAPPQPGEPTRRRRCCVDAVMGGFGVPIQNGGSH
nr:hypothetical protein Iba_chr06cCG14210 [Ipomoea batatas]